MEGLVINDVAQIIATIGFPAFIAIWLLYYGKKQQEELTKALVELKLEVHLTRQFIEHFINSEGKKEDE